MSGRQDSNLRPPRPKRGAIPGYATPRSGIFSLIFKESAKILLTIEIQKTLLKKNFGCKIKKAPLICGAFK